MKIIGNTLAVVALSLMAGSVFAQERETVRPEKPKTQEEQKTDAKRGTVDSMANSRPVRAIDNGYKSRVLSDVSDIVSDAKIAGEIETVIRSMPAKPHPEFEAAIKELRAGRDEFRPESSAEKASVEAQYAVFTKELIKLSSQASPNSKLPIMAQAKRAREAVTGDNKAAGNTFVRVDALKGYTEPIAEANGLVLGIHSADPAHDAFKQGEMSSYLRNHPEVTREQLQDKNSKEYKDWLDWRKCEELVAA